MDFGIEEIEKIARSALQIRHIPPDSRRQGGRGAQHRPRRSRRIAELKEPMLVHLPDDLVRIVRSYTDPPTPRLLVWSVDHAMECPNYGRNRTFSDCIFTPKKHACCWTMSVDISFCPEHRRICCPCKRSECMCDIGLPPHDKIFHFFNDCR